MKKEINKLISILFLSIFFLKMVISVAPLIIAHFNKQTVHAVIMQLEIENDVKSENLKEKPVKESFTLGQYGFSISHPVQLILPSMINTDHNKHVQTFYPQVPTPPPNV